MSRTYSSRSYGKRSPKKKMQKSRTPSAAALRKVMQMPAPPVPAHVPRTGFGRFMQGVGRVLEPVATNVLGALGKRAISMIKGQGDYDISGITQNSLVGKMSPTIPQFSNGLNGSIHVVHREYLTDISSSTDFSLLQFPINPALPSTFPWLSKIAANFEQYQIDGLIFEFKSGSSDALNSTNTALGYVVMATEYNSLAPQYQNKLEMENAIFAASTKPSLSCIHAIECAPNQSPLNILYTRTGFESIGASDIRLYDLGTFNLATIGMQAIGANIGELWISYSIRLYKTRFLAPGLTIPTYSMQFQDVNTARSLIGEEKSQLIKINTLALSTSSVFNVSSSTCATTFSFPPGSAGSYVFNYMLTGQLSQNAPTTRPFQTNPFNSLVNITERSIYPSDEAKLGINQDARPWNYNVTLAAQAPSSVSQLLTYSFTINNNNLAGSFTFFITQGELATLVTSLTVPPYNLGVCYITLVNASL